MKGSKPCFEWPKPPFSIRILSSSPLNAWFFSYTSLTSFAFSEVSPDFQLSESRIKSIIIGMHIFVCNLMLIKNKKSQIDLTC